MEPKDRNYISKQCTFIPQWVSQGKSQPLGTLEKLDDSRAPPEEGYEKPPSNTSYLENPEKDHQRSQNQLRTMLENQCDLVISVGEACRIQISTLPWKFTGGLAMETLLLRHFTQLRKPLGSP